MRNILVTGPYGFVGSRVVQMLLNEGHNITIVARKKIENSIFMPMERVHFIQGDFDQPSTLPQIPQNIDAAYYFLHSMGKLTEDLLQKEQEVATLFLQLITQTNCQQIIYLAGIIEENIPLSSHLQSRLAVEEILKKSKIPLTTLRSSIIIGSLSASFEIIRDLVEKLPFMIAPKWVKSQCQPIAICDVLFYLKEVLLNPICFHKTYDIGGDKAFTFKELLLFFAKFRQLKRIILDIPLLTPKLSSYWLVFITKVKYSICSYLVDSMKYSSIKKNYLIDQDIPHHLISIEQAFTLALQDVEQDEFLSFFNQPYSQQSIPLFSPKIASQACFKFTKTIYPFCQNLNDIFSKDGVSIKLPFIKETKFTPIFIDRKINRILFNLKGMKIGEIFLELNSLQEKQEAYLTFIFRPRGLGGRMFWPFLYLYLKLNFKYTVLFH